MRYILTFIILALGVSCITYAPITCAGNPEKPVRSFPRLPASFREAHFQKVQQGFEARTQKFLKNNSFTPWVANRPKAEIMEEFKKVLSWRFNCWYVSPGEDTLESREEFAITQALLLAGNYRRPHLLAFQYNNTDPSYNSSTIVLNGFRFLALEAPTEKTVTAFFNLLHNYHVKGLVRLTPSYEQHMEKSYPYWEGRNVSVPSAEGFSDKQNTAKNYLQIPLETEESKPVPYRIQYYSTDTWIDNHGFNAKDLLELILQVKNQQEASSLIAVHCNAGVGRTGTFIAGYLLLQEIDRQIANGVAVKDINVSIEKVVKQLSLQRFYMVAQPEQYVTLYRLLDLYLEKRDL